MYFKFSVCFLCISVAEVQFERPRYSVAEDDADGCANITIVSSIAVPTEFDVEVSFSDDSATGVCTVHCLVSQSA